MLVRFPAADDGWRQPARRKPHDKRGDRAGLKDYGLLPQMTALDTVAYPPLRRPWRTRDFGPFKAQQLLDRLGAVNASRKPAQLSWARAERGLPGRGSPGRRSTSSTIDRSSGRPRRDTSCRARGSAAGVGGGGYLRHACAAEERGWTPGRSADRLTGESGGHADSSYAHR